MKKNVASDISDDCSCPEKKKLSLVKIIPGTVTISALCFGLSAIRFSLLHRWETAVLCIFISALLDAFDGRVARFLGQSSLFGAELDSLSDLVCFGVAPSLVLFMKTLHVIDNSGWGICMFFTICCALRLARFNVMDKTHDNKQNEWKEKYFTGIPAPAGAILALFPMILSFAFDNDAFLTTWFVSLCILVSGVLMISTIKSFSSKMIKIKNGFVSAELLIMSFIIICLITSLWITLSVLICIYIAIIPYGAYQYIRTEEQVQKGNKR